MRYLLMIFGLFFLQSCSHLFYHPSDKHFVDPMKFKLNYQDVFFKSKDSVNLHGWFFPAKSNNPKGTVIQFHGNAQNISTHFFSLIWLIDHGYNLFTFDYRGYGKSEGKPNQEGIYLDALAALEKGRELHEKNGKGKFIVYGQSLGGAVSLRAIPDFKYSNNISLIVMDSAFASYKDIAFDRLKNIWFLWPVSPLAFLLVSDKYAADEVYEKITRPTLVIVGMKDDVIPPQFGKDIYKGVKSKDKWLWKLPHGSHIDAYHHDNGIYRQQFLDLVEKINL
ncbi:MAG: alpha/beta hydrolase [Bacteriovoracaceae bacterium]|nr:alpha/beta hydrolase [Bacteriovoracaceae bacterium]